MLLVIISSVQFRGVRMICYLSRSALLHHLDEVNQVTEVYFDRIILLGVHTLLLLVLLINSKMYNSCHILNKQNT